MFLYSRKSRQRTPDQPGPSSSSPRDDSGNADNNAKDKVTPRSSNNNSTNTNKNNSNASPTSPSNPSQSPRGMVSVSAGTSSPSPHRRMSKDSEGYPSWLPKRPPPPAPASTFHSSVGVPDFEQEFGVLRYPDLHDQDHERPSPEDTEGASAAPYPGGGRRPTSRSVRIVSLQDTYLDQGVAQYVAAGRNKGKQAERPHIHVHTQDPVGLAPNTPAADAWSRARGAHVSGAAQAAALSSPQHPRFNAQGLHLQIFRSPSKLSRIYFYLYPLLVFAHIPLQTYFDFNAVFILLQVSKFPNPMAPGIPGSGRNWALGATAYIACWLVWILIVTVLYEIIYSFFRRWRVKRPAIMPLYLSSSAFNLVCMTSYTNFCFMQHLRISAFTSERGSLRDGLAETFYFYSQNLPTVALLLPRAGLSLALLFSFSSPLPDVFFNNSNGVTYSLMRRDGTFFNDDNGSLTGYARGVLIANAAWTAWRILVLLCSWVSLWTLSGQGCAGLCGPRYRWEEEEVEKRRYSYVYGDAGSEDLGSSLAWSWRQCTRMRVRHAYEFCLTTERPVSWAEKRGQGVEDDGVAQVLAAVGFPSVPPPARRGVLSGDLFQDPKQLSASADLPQVMKRTSKERQQLTEPYPFTMQGAQVSSANKMVPFPHSASGESREREENPSSGATSGSTEGMEITENPTTSSGKTRGSDSFSSFGQPVTSRYPFQFRHPPAADVRVMQREVSDSSSETNESSNTGESQTTQSTGNIGSSEGTTSSSSDQSHSSSSGNNIPMPPRHPQQGQGRDRGRTRAGTVPAVVPVASPTVATPGTTVVFPRSRTQTIQQTDVYSPAEMMDYEEQRHQVGDDDHSIASSHSEDDSVGLLSPASVHSARVSPRTSLIASAIRGNIIGGYRGSAPASRAHSHSSAASGAVSSPPASSSSRSFHSSFGSVNVSVVGAATAAAVRSRSGSRVRGRPSRTRTSSASAYVRSRAQSLMQGIGAASQSSMELVQGVISRSRTNSMMTRLEEGEETGSPGNTLRIRQAQHRNNHDNDRLDMPTHDRNGGDGMDGLEYDERVSGLYDAQQQHLDYYSDGRTHSRSGSGSASAMSSSNENYTFGLPFPHRTRLQQMGEGETVEEEGEQEIQEVQVRRRSLSSSSQSVMLGGLQGPTPAASSSSHSTASRQGAASRPTQPVPAAVSPMRPRTYHRTTTEGTTSLSSSPPDMISTAAESFITAPVTVEGSTTTGSSVFGATVSDGGQAGQAGGVRGVASLQWGSDMVARADRPGGPPGGTWRPA
ncbi:hypothetical protein AX17_005395 [Amanita inopinata Kibby_2008]|nr:hypothetical protein AX17_005395 [Amanita inopinata Kibby_2008]